MNNRSESGSAVHYIVTLISASLLAAAIIAGAFTEELAELFLNLHIILMSPAALSTDYFLLGGLSASLFNAGVCGLVFTILIRNVPDAGKDELAGYFLVIAHCFYGLNLINMWPPVIGIFIFSRIRRLSFMRQLPAAMFSTAFGPFFSELFFRYPGSAAESSDVVISVAGEKISLFSLILSLLLSLFLGFAIPPMLEGAKKLHRGFNLYNAGLAFGLLGLLITAFLYRTMGIQPPEKIIGENEAFLSHESSYFLFSNIFFILLFGIILITGLRKNKTGMDFTALVKDSGFQSDFLKNYSERAFYINLSLYGLMMLAYLDLVIIAFPGEGFTGPSFGIIFAAVAFSASGQHPRIVLPVLSGYLILFLCASGIAPLLGVDLSWSPSAQGYMNAAAFATGLCPFAGKHGWAAGACAGLISAILCTSTAAIHSGLVLYNGGFTAGLAALLLLPFIDYYGKKDDA